MSTEISLLDEIAAAEARENAIAGCEANNLEWVDRAFGVLESLARRSPTVLVEDVKRAMGDDQPHTPSAYGPLMLRGAKAGLLVRLPGLRYALSTKSHSERATWQSRVYQRSA